MRKQRQERGEPGSASDLPPRQGSPPSCVPARDTTASRTSAMLAPPWAAFSVENKILSLIAMTTFFSGQHFVKLQKYDNTFTGELENTEQDYIQFYGILQFFS